MSGTVQVRGVSAADTVALRRRILRPGMPYASVCSPLDDDPQSRHLGALVDGAVVGVLTLLRAGTPLRPDARAVQLRYMAVDTGAQGTGVGRRLVEEAVQAARADDIEVIWANARLRAVGFYERLGFARQGPEFAHAESGLPHVVVIRTMRAELDAPTPA